MRPRTTWTLIALIALIALVAIPALAASPSPAPSGSAATPGRPAGSDKPGNGPKADKAKTPSVQVTLTGRVGTQTDASGVVGYTLTDGSRVYTLDAGPSWFWKDKHPLGAFVGKTVRLAGELKQGTTEVDVLTVDGKDLREPGKPPWAGGWKVVGQDHPGWSQEKADRWAAKIADKKARFGLDCWPPGHCKDASGKPQTPAATPTPAP